MDDEKQTVIVGKKEKTSEEVWFAHAVQSAKADDLRILLFELVV